MTITERSLSVSAGMPLTRTIVERKSVKKVKLTTKPVITPNGRAFPVCAPPMVDERIIGRSGRMHGESTVTIPAKKARLSARSRNYWLHNL